LCQIAVVSQHKQALGLGIEAASVEQVVELCRQQIENGIARVWVAPGGNEAGRFVQNDAERWFHMNQASIDLYMVTRSRFRAEIRANLAVDGDFAFGNQFIALPARADPRCSQVAVQSHGD